MAMLVNFTISRETEVDNNCKPCNIKYASAFHISLENNLEFGFLYDACAKFINDDQKKKEII